MHFIPPPAHASPVLLPNPPMRHEIVRHHTKILNEDVVMAEPLPFPSATTSSSALQVPFTDEFNEDIEENFCYSHDITELPEKSMARPKMKKIKDLEFWSRTLNPKLQKAVADTCGKKNNNIKLGAELVLRHALPAVLNSGVLDADTLDELDKATPLVVV